MSLPFFSQLNCVCDQVPPQVRIGLVQCYRWRHRLPLLMPARRPPQHRRSQETDQQPKHADMDVALPTVALLTLDPTTRRILRHEDRWWGQPTTYGGGVPFMGDMHGLVKRVNGALWEAWARRHYG